MLGCLLRDAGLEILDQWHNLKLQYLALLSQALVSVEKSELPLPGFLFQSLSPQDFDLAVFPNADFENPVCHELLDLLHALKLPLDRGFLGLHSPRELLCEDFCHLCSSVGSRREERWGPAELDVGNLLR